MVLGFHEHPARYAVQFRDVWRATANVRVDTVVIPDLEKLPKHDDEDPEAQLHGKPLTALLADGSVYRVRFEFLGCGLAALAIARIAAKTLSLRTIRSYGQCCFPFELATDLTTSSRVSP